MPAAAASTRRWLRPLRPGWKAVASSAAPTVRSGSVIATGGPPSTRASPCARPQQAEQDPHRRRLAGAVGPEEAGHPPGLDREGEVVDGDGLAVALGQIADLELGHRERSEIACRALAPSAGRCGRLWSSPPTRAPRR